MAIQADFVFELCGKGKCNKVGCDYEGGCIDGDPEKNFFEKHGKFVSSFGPDLLDLAANKVVSFWNDHLSS